MSRYHSYLSSAADMLNRYTGAEPFVHFSRKFFAANKKFGSRDRKAIAALCYGYFRSFHLFPAESLENRILYSVFLCETEPGDLLATLSSGLNENIHLPLPAKLALLGKDHKALLPQFSELSNLLNKDALTYSLLRQPLLYLRVRPGKQQSVINKLNQAQLPFTQLKEDCLSLKNATSLDTILKINREVVVQDYNSQRVFDYLVNQHSGVVKEGGMRAWDCCAASGGKSILLYDRTASKVQLTVSDIRKSILHNLQERLQAAGVPIYKAFMADLVQGLPDVADKFDLVICDVPCTGSGTWSRTPEQLAFFKTNMIEEYSAKQIAIAGNATALLKKGGLFFYITCSVFEKENEQIVTKLRELHSMKLLHQQYYEGYHMQADTLFVAVLTQ